MFKYFKHITIIVICLLSQISNTYADNINKQEIKTVVIDAGHGGKDGGCHGAHSHEKHIALKIALLLGGYIDKYIPEVNVIYTRKTDIFIELEERAAIANRNNADLFISIHCNAASPAAFGTETFVMGLHKTDGNLNVAKRENSVIELEDNYKERYNFDPNSPESYILLSLNQNAYLEQSTLFASLIQEQFEKRVGRFNRGVKQAGFWVLWRTTMPSVLIETGFLTNKSEEEFLASTQGQEYIASAIYRAFKDYKAKMESNLSEITQPKEEIEGNFPLKIEKPVEEKTAPPVPPLNKEVKEASAVKQEVPNLYFKIQLLVSKQLFNLSQGKYAKVGDIHFEKSNEYFRYLLGPFTDYKTARAAQQKAWDNGFSDAFFGSLSFR